MTELLPAATAVGPVELTVRDLDRSLAYYTRSMLVAGHPVEPRGEGLFTCDPSGNGMQFECSGANL